MKLLTVSLLVCAMMALTTAAAVPEAEPDEMAAPPSQEAVPEAEPDETAAPPNEEAVPEAEPDETAAPPSQEDESQTVLMSLRCPDGWTGYNGRCFKYISTHLTWANAERICQSHGGNLASVHNWNEYHAIQTMILRLTHAYVHVWLGGSDAQQEGTWFWTDGTPFNFHYWCRGEPDNFRHQQHCLVMNYGDERKFDDQQCFYTKPFVCAIKS